MAIDNEVVIHVRIDKIGAKTSFEEVGKESDLQATKISKSFSEKFSETFKQTFVQRVKTIFSSSGAGAAGATDGGRSWGDYFGRAASERISVNVSERIKQDVNGRWRDVFTGRFSSGPDGGDGGRGGKGGDAHVNVDVDKQSIWSKFASIGKTAGDKFTNAFGGVASTFFSGDFITLLLKVLGGAGLGLLLAGPIGAAITAGVGLALGGGGIVAGLVGAFKDPAIQNAAQDSLRQIKGLFEDFSSNFKGPLYQFFVGGDANGGGGINGVIAQISPMVKLLGRDLGEVAGKLGSGIIGLLQNLLPPILRSMELSVPIVDALAEKLPKIGEHIGHFFQIITQQSPGAAVFLKDLIDLILWLVDVIGYVISGATQMYLAFRTAFSVIVGVASDAAEAIAGAFSWIPGLGPKLESAAGKTRAFRDRMNNNLHSIDKNIQIKVQFKVIGLAAANAAIQAGQLLAGLGYAHGGIVGAATGGLHGGLRMVGEHGPELVQLPPGSRVNSNADTERLMSGGGGGLQQIVVPVYLDGKQIAQAMAEPMRDAVRTLGQGSVQRYLGQPGVA